MRLVIDTNWAAFLPIKALPLFGYIKQKAENKKDASITKKELKEYGGMKTEECIAALAGVVDFSIKNHESFFIKILQQDENEDNVSANVKDADLILDWLQKQREFSKLKIPSTKYNILENIIYEMLHGRYIQAHRWDGSYASQLPQKFENDLTKEKVSGKKIIEYLEIAMTNFRMALSFNFFKPFFTMSKNKILLHPADFFVFDYDSGFSGSLFLEFSINHSFWKIPEEWSRLVWQIIHPDDYEALRNASQFINYLETNWEKFLNLNQKFITQSKSKVLDLIIEKVKEMVQFQIKRCPLPSPNSLEFSIFRQEFEKININFPGIT